MPALDFPLEGERVRIEAGDDGRCAIIRRADELPVGTLELESNSEELVVRRLCIDEPHRSYGCGSEAGWLLLQAAEHAGFELVSAHAPPDRGLAVYFWIRMGLRPLHGEGPDGGIWFERRLG
jgi:hypothetical protein